MHTPCHAPIGSAAILAQDSSVKALREGVTSVLRTGGTTADKAAAEEERVAAVEERAAAANESRICQTEFIVELAVLCDCVSELEEERTWIFKI